MKKLPNTGFSLIELAIVIIIVGILLAASLSLGSAQIQASNIKDTKMRLQRVEEALQLYYETEGKLPCPASGKFGNEHADFGVAEEDGTSCDVSDLLPGSGTPNYFSGVVPTRTLTLPDEYMFDSWGNRVTYVVSEHCVDPNKWTPIDTGSGAVHGCHTGTATTVGGNITIKDNTGNNDRTVNAVFAIISHGKNGAGAWTRYFGNGTANTKISGTVSTYEERNAHLTDAYDNIFSDDVINDGNVAANYYDDIVRWKTGPQVEYDKQN